MYAAGVLVGALLWGVVSDRVGHGRILIIGLIGYVVSLLLLLVPGVESVWVIYALRGTTGFFVAAVIPVVSALVAEYTPEEQRARRSAGTGLVLPVIAYLAAGASANKLGTTMGGLAAAAGLGQTPGSAAGGWLFGAFAQRSFGWLTVPLIAMLIFLLARPHRWSGVTAKFNRDATSQFRARLTPDGRGGA